MSKKRVAWWAPIVPRFARRWRLFRPYFWQPEEIDAAKRWAHEMRERLFGDADPE